MRVHRENDPIRLSEAVDAQVLGEGHMVLVPAGALGAVVMVHGDPSRPMANEVEFYMPELGCHALAVLEAGNAACMPLAVH
ncbi:MAG: hypothetical protein KF740_19765 [Ramlibacter sp.]|nr:hypothetical protein [Ramlibacter sp.]